MQTRRLGRTDLDITTIGFGAWAIGGGGWAFGWGPQDDADSIAAIRRSVELGINWIDTAAAYGLGRSETVVARALEDIPRAERPYVFTKCSLVWDEARTLTHTLRGSVIRRECEDSLRRLQMERIDVYQIHWPKWAGASSAAEGSIEEAWGTLADLQREGKVRHIGVSNFDKDELARAEAIAPVGSLQPPYSVLRRDVELEVLPFCRQHGIGVIVYSPMQSGLLSGRMTRDRVASLAEDDWRRKATWFNEPHLTRGLRVAEVLGDIGRRSGRTAGHVAIAWTLRHAVVTGAIVGARTPGQIEELADAGSLQLTDEDVATIERTLEETAVRA